MQSLQIITGITVQQSCFSMLLSVVISAYFVVTHRKFSYEMRFLMELLCNDHCT